MIQETETLPRELAPFYAQRPEWTFDHESGVEYATIEVPRDYADPDGERLAIALSRRRAADGGRRRGILLSVNGGPGGDSGLGRDLPAELMNTPAHQVYDLIGFDPRGTGASTPLYAEVTNPVAPFDSRPPDSVFSTLAEDMRQRELACARAGGDLRPHVSTRNIARDMDVIRAVLGEETLNFVGYAYGTYVGAVYGSMFPAHLDRSVLDSCVNPDWSWREQFLSQGDAISRNVDQWSQWTAERNVHFGLGSTQDEVMHSVETVVARLEALEGGAHLRTLYDGAVGTRATNRGEWQDLGRLTADLLEATEAGDAERARTLVSPQGIWRSFENDNELRPGVLDAVTLEHDWETDLEVYYTAMRDFRQRFPYGYGVLRAQPWVGAFRTFDAPETPARIERDGYPVGLIVQSEGDPMDHYAGAVAMADRLGHHLVTVDDSGEHEIYALCGNPHVDGYVNRYLVEGQLPPERVSCPGMIPRPDVAPDR